MFGIRAVQLDPICDCSAVPDMIRCWLAALVSWFWKRRHTGHDHAHVEENVPASRSRAQQELAALLQSLDKNPDSAQLLLDLGVAFARHGDLDRSIEYFRRGTEVAPESSALHNNLGLSLQKCGRLSEATACFRSALQLDPALSAAWHNLGNALNELGQVEEGGDAYRRCLAIAPDHVAARSDFLLSLNYRQDVSPDEVFKAHREWARRHAIRPEPVKVRSEFQRDCGARLRLGYLSPNFKHHSVAFFIEPVLEHHDRSRFQVFAYADVYAGDEVTKRIAGKVESWRDVSALGVEQIAAQILEDKIDLLVDLAGHTSFRQMLLMSMRLAPVQVTYLGYPNTTGLDTVDFRLTDDVADPEGQADRYASERLVRLPRGFLCYRPPVSSDMPQAGEAPCLSREFVTFGSFNNLNKISPLIMGVWADILRQVPASRLHLKARQLADATTRARIADGFEQLGVDANRLSIFPWAATQHEHLRLYNEIDIALDTFPYNGTTTTCEALWMGVPVVTLFGRTHASRVSLSLLRQCGLEELAAATEEDYINKSVSLAADRQRLQKFHSELRPTLASSSLLDGEGFCKRLESAYLSMLENLAATFGAGGA